jgi:hypothetical protein
MQCPRCGQPTPAGEAVCDKCHYIYSFEEYKRNTRARQEGLHLRNVARGLGPELSDIDDWSRSVDDDWNGRGWTVQVGTDKYAYLNSITVREDGNSVVVIYKDPVPRQISPRKAIRLMAKKARRSR